MQKYRAKMNERYFFQISQIDTSEILLILKRVV